eukprot:14517551-Alexandrium_andersonii.AAC.1
MDSTFQSLVTAGPWRVSYLLGPTGPLLQPPSPIMASAQLCLGEAFTHAVGFASGFECFEE